MRYFRISDDGVYEQARTWLDSQFGHASPCTCVDPAAVAPRGSDGFILLAVRDAFVEFAAVQQVLPSLLVSGAVSEVSESTYRSAIQPYSFQ